MKKVIGFLALVPTIVAIQLFSIATLLIWMPELLTGSLRMGVAVSCIVVGSCMAAPILIIVLFNVRKKLKSYTHR